MTDDLEDVAARIVEAAEPERFVQAIAIGLVADEEFADQCAMRGLSVETALASPLEIIGAWPMGGVTGSA